MFSDRGNRSDISRILFIAYGDSVPMTGGVRLIRECLAAFREKVPVDIVFWPDSFGYWARRIPWCFALLRILYAARKSKSSHVVYDSRLYAVLTFLPWFAKKLRIRTITIYQGSHLRIAPNECRSKTWLRRVLLTSTVHESETVIANSSLASKELVSEYGRPKDTTCVVLPGFQAYPWKESPSDLEENRVLRILVPARYQWIKGLDVLLEAVRMMKSRHVRVKIVGARQSHEPGHYAQLLRLARDLPVEMAGYVDQREICSVYKSCDVVVIPSRVETFGIVVLEGLWYGCPVICSDALPEEIRKASDYVKSFRNGDAAELADIMDDYATRKMSGERLRFPYPLIEADQWSWGRFRDDIQTTFFFSTSAGDPAKGEGADR